MKRFAALVVAAASLLVLPACGDKTDETSRAAGITPVNALGLVSLNLDPSIAQKRNLLGIIRRFPDAKKEVKGEFDEARDDLIADLLEDTGLEFKRDVEPWLGNEVAVAVLPPGEGDTPLIVALVETDDETKARAAIEKATKSGDFEGVYAVVDEFVVISDQEDEADDQRALDLVTAQAKKDDGGLAESKAFTDVVDELAGDRLILGWANVKEALKLVEDLGGIGQLDFARGFGEDASSVAADLHAEDDAMVFQAVADASGDGDGTAAKLTRSLPAGTLAALTLFNVGKGITDGITAFTGGEGGDFLAQIEADTGIDLEDDILSWMQGELIFVAGDVPPGGKFPEFALVVEPSDDGKAQSGMDKVRKALADQGFTFEEREVAGAKAYVAPEELPPGIQPAMALFPDRFVLASSAEYLGELANGQSPGLAGTDGYKSVLGDDASGDTTMQFVALLDPIREAIENAFLDDAEDRAEYEKDVKPNVEPLAAFGMAARQDGKFSKFEMKLTFDD